ncbi:MAG TPA: GNAT family N-acetyltransferase [Rhizomicrobium sp.]
MTILTTKRRTLRPLSTADAPALLAARSDVEVMRYWDWPAQTSVEQVENIIADHFSEVEDGNVLWWAVALSPDGPAIDECDLSEIDHHHRRAEVGFLFNRAYWGKGFAFEAMQAVIAHGFGALQLERLWARVHAGNTASQRLLERLGFVREGTMKAHILRDGARRDCEIYGLVR